MGYYYKKPKFEDFKRACDAAQGSKTKISEILGVTRMSVRYWCQKDKKFADYLDEYRGKKLDELINRASALAVGIPKVKNGRIVGWVERPDGYMLRYLIGKLGYAEGFGEKLDITSNGESIKPEPVTIRFVADREQLEKIEAEVPDVKE